MPEIELLLRLEAGKRSALSVHMRVCLCIGYSFNLLLSCLHCDNILQFNILPQSNDLCVCAGLIRIQRDAQVSAVMQGE